MEMGIRWFSSLTLILLLSVSLSVTVLNVDCDQSYKHSTIVNHNASVVPTGKGLRVQFSNKKLQSWSVYKLTTVLILSISGFI